LRSSPHHPEGDGLAERTVQSAKLKLRLLLAERKVPSYEWPTLLAEVAFLLNAQTNASTKFSPHELYYGSRLRHPVLAANIASVSAPAGLSNEESVATTRARVLESSAVARQNLCLARRKAKHFYDRKTKPKNIGVGDFVLVDNRYRRSGLDTTFGGPYEVKKRVGPNLTLEGKRGRKVIHVNRCKKFHVKSTEYPITLLVDDDVWDAETDDGSHEPNPPRRSERPRCSTIDADYVYY
jgi:hypothetical protein